MLLPKVSSKSKMTKYLSAIRMSGNQLNVRRRIPPLGRTKLRPALHSAAIPFHVAQVYLLSTLSLARMMNSTFRLEIIMLFNGKHETSC